MEQFRNIQPPPSPMLEGYAGESGHAQSVPVPLSAKKDLLFGLFRRYFLLAFGLILLGGAAGFASVVFSTPVYSAHVLLEIQGVSQEFLKNTHDPLAATYDASQTGIQTQVVLLRSGPFLNRVLQRLQFETVQPIPPQPDIFSRLRRMVERRRGVAPVSMAETLKATVGTFEARPINGTRLVELSCEASHPGIAANFINTVAAEFVEDSARTRSVTSRKTSEWLQGQIEETRANLKDAQERLQSFVRGAGNGFASQGITVDDVKLKRLQAELAAIQADRIGRQAQYERVSKADPEALPDLVPDSGLKVYTSELANLRKEKMALLTTLTPHHLKVQRVQAQIDEITATLQRETAGFAQRVRSEYETALRREGLLRSAYGAQAGQVVALSDRAAQYDELRREVELQQQLYTSLLNQQNQASVSNSLPIAPVRLVEPSGLAELPDKPRPPANIAVGILGGFALTALIVLLREKLDQRVRTPEVARVLIQAPQLGIIPSASSPAAPVTGIRRIRLPLPSRQPDPTLALDSWKQGSLSTPLKESFRSTLVSLLGGHGRHPQMIVVSSAAQGEGKTTISANLGYALAESGRSVLLMDCDFRQPRLHLEVGLSNDWGITTLMQETCPVADYDLLSMVLPTTTPGLFVLPGGPRWDEMPRLLHSARFQELLLRIRQTFDLAIIDSSPILQFADARLLGHFSDGVVLAMRAGVTLSTEAVEAYRLLSEDHIVLLGTILNDWAPSAQELRRRYYYSQAKP